MTANFVHVDVFAEVPFSGNSLTVFLDPPALSSRQLLTITQEFRHFETAFVWPHETDPQRFRARIFDLVEELPFAGHPLLGAAAVMHRAQRIKAGAKWMIDLSGRSLSVSTRWDNDRIWAWMDQGEPWFHDSIVGGEEVAGAFGLKAADLDPSLPIATVSTGLKYLVIPVRRDALAKARIQSDITPLVNKFGAQFAVLFDNQALEIRHWNNDGLIEDVATGSAAGAIGAYRMRYCRARSGQIFGLNQGRFAGRPSVILVQPVGNAAKVQSVQVGGAVCFVAAGRLETVPGHESTE